MTNVIFFKKDGYYTGFTVSGHAMFNQKGKDIVCAAISVLTINTINALDEINHESMDVDMDENKGLLKMVLLSHKEESSQTLMKTLVLGLESIQKEYGRKYCKVDYKEEDANVKA